MLESELHRKISEELNIPIERVIAYDKLHWRQLKIDMNSPTFAVVEVPHLGTFTVTYSKVRSTLKFHLRILKQIRKRIKYGKREASSRLLEKYEFEKENFRRIWKLKNQMIKERHEEIEGQLRYVAQRREKFQQRNNS